MSLISLKEAAAQGIERVRKPVWANKMDHLKLDIIDGKIGPWIHLYAPFNKECNECDPVDFCWMLGPMKTSTFEAEFEPYTGPLPDSDEYKAAVASYEGCLK